MSRLMLVTLTALLLCAVQARPQNQDALAKTLGGAATDDDWEPTLDKDKWRAFEPRADVSTTRWWEMRLDDKLWQVPVPQSTPEEDIPGEPRPSQAGGDGNAAAIAPPSELPLPSSHPNILAAPSPTPNMVESQQKIEASDIASQMAAMTSAAKALVEATKSVLKKNNATQSSSNKEASETKPTVKTTEAPSPKKDTLPGETGYLRPFYRKGDNNPFVDEEDTMPYYGAGMSSQDKLNGRPYLPVMHNDVATAKDTHPAKINDDSVVEGGEIVEKATPATSPVFLQGDTLKEKSKDIASDSSHQEPEQVKDEETGASELLREAEKLPTPLAQTALSKDGDSESLKTISKAKKPEYIKPASLDQHKTKLDEMPQADEPFVDWPDWDSSLFDSFDDEDDSNDKDASDKKLKQETSSSNKSDELKEKVKEPLKHEEKDDKQKDHSSDSGDFSDNDFSDDDDDVDDDDDYDEDYDYYDEDDDDAETSDDDDDDHDNVDEEDEEDDESENDSDDDEYDNESDDKRKSSNLDSKSVSNDDSYYYDDDSDSDSDSKEDSYEVIEKHDGGITISPIKTPAADPSRVASRKKRLDWDEVPLEAEQPSDESHYSKGIIYDAPPVNKGLVDSAQESKGSKSEDVHILEGETLHNEKGEIVVSQNNPTMIRSKKGESLTQFQPTRPHTESDASTSPNPRPPVAAGDESTSTTNTPTPSTTSTTTTTTTTTSTTTTTPTMKPVQVDDLPRDDLEHLPVSYPLEFCQEDYECRAGRTCQQGMCKCVPISWCDHSVAVEEGFITSNENDISYLPVCGSDGKHYRSHCHLHRTACISRSHIRVDRHGVACSQAKQPRDEEKPVHKKEKSWLMEQERLLQEEKQKQKQQQQRSDSPKMMADQPVGEDAHKDASQSKVVIPEQEIVHFPQREEITSSVKKDGKNLKPMALTSSNSLKSPYPKEKCTWSQMNEFKDALLFYYCHKFVEPNCPLEVKSERQYLSMLMYSYYDKDFDYFLTAQELDDKERDEHFDNHTVRNCHLHDFVKFADTMGTPDGKLTITEFSKAFEIINPTEQPETTVEVISTLASAGNGLELKCGIDSDAVIWKKQGAQLSDDKRSHQLTVFDDGALFFSKVGLHHVGNYTCMDAENPSISQIHRLRVQTMPKVTVNPVTQSHTRGLDIELRCHAEGVPKPTLHWSKGDQPLHTSKKTSFYYDSSHVVIHKATAESDAGTYTCTAHNQAGTTKKSVSVSVLAKDAPVSDESPKEAGTFVVFHPQGITAYDPLHCLIKHKVNGMFGNFKFIPDAMEEPLTLCKPDSDCEWGSAVRVGKDFIYASQPDQNRVLVMQASGSWLPLQVIDTDARPSQIWYVKHLDQVWVLCKSQQQGPDGTSIIVVIRDASQHIQHRSVHTRPVGNHFDMVQNLFIAPANDLDHEFDFGYVSHKGQKGLFKINLEDMSYTKAVDLSSYGCVPTNVAFVPIGGHVVVQCVSAADQHSLQLILDYLTDTVTSTVSLTGRPMTSPDSRHLITVDQFTGRVTVASISEEGVMATTYEVTVSASISDVAFMPASSHQGYDLILTSADDDDVIIMNLVTGKVEKISGSMYSNSSRTWHPSAVKRRIATADTLSSFLMAPAMSSLDILDITFRQVECEFSNSESDVIIHVPSWQTS
ncbi:hypothetical protein EGW08_016713 [Elysia chlorotica]|uniref:Kazal-like domain-containing protein n=1 Tax=Elysia chlorotica TaxID=188477 RepID=A0A3S0ZIC7_ELYCH|nr:hypothetical protein EGW08_016713 [Elysia chlorotica]